MSLVNRLDSQKELIVKFKNWDYLTNQINRNIISSTVDQLLALSEHPKVLRRQFQQGVTLIYSGDDDLICLLLFRDVCYGLLLHSNKCPQDVINEDLKDFRFGWLPLEIVAEQGGYGVSYASDAMPQEAEGFVPTFIIGSTSGKFTGYGAIIQEKFK